MTQENLMQKTDTFKIFKNAKEFSHKQNKIINVFFKVAIASTFLSLIAAVLYYVYAYASLSQGDHSFDWLLGIFSDFVYIMNVSLGESPYVAQDSSYPPFAIFILYPFALICRSVFAKYSELELSTDELTTRVLLHPEFWISITLFFFICSILLIISLILLFNFTTQSTSKLAIIILTSAPFAFTIMRGNTIYFALIFTLLFLVFEKNEKAVIREIGYLFLVLAGLIKIYPLFFGIFLLYQKKLWALARIAAYSVILFFLSFFLFRGIEDIIPFFKNLGGFATNDIRLIAPNNLSLSSLMYKIVRVFSSTATNSMVFRIILISVLFTLFTVSAISAILTKNTFSRYVIVSSIVILIPSISYFYVLIFLSLPFIEFLKKYEEIESKKQVFYFFAFLFLFLTPTMIAQNYIIHSLLVITMLIIEIVSSFGERKNPPHDLRI